MAQHESLIAIDLFSGAGGLSLGLRNAGFLVKAAVEFDQYAAQTYRANLGDHLLETDIRGLAADDLLDLAGIAPGECDLLAGGPPCQGFSVQRRGDDTDHRNDMVLEFARFIEEVRPKMFLMENVSGLTSNRGKPYLTEFLRRVADLGYLAHIDKLDAIDYGVPQFRKRVILVGQRQCTDGRPFRFPLATHSPDSYLSVRDAIEWLPPPPADGSPHPKFANHARETRISKLNLERLSHIPPGGGREHLPVHLQLPCHVNNPLHRHVEVYGRLHWDKPSGTITARFDSFTRGRFAHPMENRSLTVREGARLQTFPDSFVFIGNREETAKQVGNAVPVKLASALGRAVIDALRPGAAANSSRRPYSPPLLFGT